MKHTITLPGHKSNLIPSFAKQVQGCVGRLKYTLAKLRGYDYFCLAGGYLSTGRHVGTGAVVAGHAGQMDAGLPLYFHF